MGERAEPPITGIPFVNLPNFRSPNQQDEKHRHRHNYWLDVTRKKKERNK